MSPEIPAASTFLEVDIFDQNRTKQFSFLEFHFRKKMLGIPSPKEKLAIWIGFTRRTKKHIIMHLLVGSNWEATLVSSAYVDGCIA